MTRDTLSTTAPRDSVLARFMLGFDGHSVTSELAEYLAGGLAGVALYARNFRSVEELRELTAAIREAARRSVLIGIDQEGGRRFALRQPFTQWPSAAELGLLNDPHAAEQVAGAIAVELRAVGCNLDFAPMLDLHVNEQSAVTTDRSFGGDPRRVAKMGVAFERGLRSGGVLSCAKHFPGHGDAVVDPHLDLPVFAGTMERLQTAELIPFQAAIAGGASLVMTAHILLPQIDPENPASLSRKMLDGVLRKQLRFDGVILADDLGMGAIAKRYGMGESAVRTLDAGTDVAMLCHDWQAVAPAIAAVRKAYQEGRLDAVQGKKALERINGVGDASEFSAPQPPLEALGCEEHLRLSRQIRERVP